MHIISWIFWLVKYFLYINGPTRNKMIFIRNAARVFSFMSYTDKVFKLVLIGTHFENLGWKSEPQDFVTFHSLGSIAVAPRARAREIICLLAAS